MKVIIQNLQKKKGLGSKLVSQHEPDVFLAQEINLSSETAFNTTNSANNTSSMGYGTLIYGKEKLSNIKRIDSPYYETGTFIKKKTTIATISGIQFVSFHGYNGQPFKNVAKLVAHVKAVLEKLDSYLPVVFAGDFNTWSQNHVDKVIEAMSSCGLIHAGSWPYPGRDLPLDHVFVRDVIISKQNVYENESDHMGIILECLRK